MKVNNVDLERLSQSVEEMKADPSKAKRTQRVEGVWNLGEGRPQFESTIKFEGGELKFEADQPTFLGGGGTRPGPIHYCLYGLASCYTATFASMAAMMNVPLRSLRTVAEMDMNFSPVFGLSDAPPNEGVRVTLFVDSDADEAKIKELEELARQRCPVVYTLTHVIPLRTEVKVE